MLLAALFCGAIAAFCFALQRYPFFRSASNPALVTGVCVCAREREREKEREREARKRKRREEEAQEERRGAPSAAHAQHRKRREEGTQERAVGEELTNRNTIPARTKSSPFFSPPRPPPAPPAPRLFLSSCLTLAGAAALRLAVTRPPRVPVPCAPPCAPPRLPVPSPPPRIPSTSLHNHQGSVGLRAH